MEDQLRPYDYMLTMFFLNTAVFVFSVAALWAVSLPCSASSSFVLHTQRSRYALLVCAFVSSAYMAACPIYGLGLRTVIDLPFGTSGVSFFLSISNLALVAGLALVVLASPFVLARIFLYPARTAYVTKDEEVLTFDVRYQRRHLLPAQALARAA